MDELPAQSNQSTPLWRDLLAIGMLVGVVFLVAVAFFWPWRPIPAAGGPHLARYVPFVDGAAQLVATYDADGAQIGWQSQNLTRISDLNIVSDLRAGPQAVIDALYYGEDPTPLDAESVLAVLNDVDVGQVRQRTLTPAGEVREELFVLLREPCGQFLVSHFETASGQELLYDPPLLLLPATLEPGATWESRGHVSGAADYRAAGQVLAWRPFPRYADCIETELQIEIDLPTGSTKLVSQDWFCAGIAAIASEVRDGESSLLMRYRLLAGDRVAPSPDTPAMPQPAQPADSSADKPFPNIADAELTRFARSLPPAISGDATIAPVWVDSSPPLLLTAATGGDLVAFDESGGERWRFRPRGAIYGAPEYDPTRGQILFGTSGRLLYALDVRGLFRWLFETGDNVATRPLVADDLVVFGSEDRNVYAVDAVSGALRWRFAAADAVVSDPARVGDMVFFGADDGLLYAVALADGTLRWSYLTEAAVEAPPVIANQTIYLAGRDGTLAALESLTGEEQWAVQAGPGTGATLRTAPALDEEAIYVVSTGGTLFAHARADGQLLWTAGTSNLYVGPPVAVAGGLIAARSDGHIDLLDRTGAVVRTWDAGAVLKLDDVAPFFHLGPTHGGQALWLADLEAVVYRLK